MTLQFCAPAAAAAAALPQLDAVVRQLDGLCQAVVECGVTASGLAAGTDWSARAARVFHERSSIWTGDVRGLECLAESLRFEAIRARDRVAALAWSCP